MISESDSSFRSLNTTVHQLAKLFENGSSRKLLSVKVFKVGDYSLIIHKSAYHLFSVLISKRGFSSLQTRKTVGEFLSGNHRFLILVIRFVTPHSCAYLLHRSSYFHVTKVLSIKQKHFLQLTIGLFHCCPLGPIMPEIINASATKLQILV